MFFIEDGAIVAHGACCNLGSVKIGLLPIKEKKKMKTMKHTTRRPVGYATGEK